jgi:hypothetical protein
MLCLFCALALLASSCGPLPAPVLPDRLDNEQQKRVDEAWEKALAADPPPDSQALLDALLLSQAYQGGVDRLHFRSEKDFSGGVVVMEVEYDRRAPAKDRFEVRVIDRGRKVLRRERYNREQIDQTGLELWKEHHRLTNAKKNGTATPEDLRRLQALDARIEAAKKLLPRTEEEEAKEKGGK